MLNCFRLPEKHFALPFSEVRRLLRLAFGKARNDSNVFNFALRLVELRFRQPENIYLLYF
ncbi:MAG: hypothetical protein IKZ88_06135 [Neisseriaceae bacterium]|nr:hypothetical protein [Neisseriaceae bacterium]